MRIISKHKDFYDSSGFIDTSFIYVRHEKTLMGEFLEKYPLPFRDYELAGKPDKGENFVYIFFCGIIYCGVWVNKKWIFNNEAKAFFPEKKDKWIWGLDERKVSNFLKRAGGSCHEINVKYNVKGVAPLPAGASDETGVKP